MSALTLVADPSTPIGRLLLVTLILLALGLVPWVGRALVVLVQGLIDVIKIRANGQVLTELAKLEPDQAECLHVRLERVRPPPDEIAPPGAH